MKDVSAFDIKKRLRVAEIEKETGKSDNSFIIDFLDSVGKATRDISVDEIQNAINLLYEGWKRQAKIFIIGMGGSASTASHFACDLSKWTIIEGAMRFRVMACTDNAALITGYANDEGLHSIFVEQIKAWIEPGDILVGVSVHGGAGEGNAGAWSQNIVGAMKYAKEQGAKLLGITGFDGGAMKRMCDVSIIVPNSDPVIGIPLVEGYHVLVLHLMCAALRAKLQRAVKR